MSNMVYGRELKMDNGCIAITSRMVLKAVERAKLLNGQICKQGTCSSTLCERRSGPKWEYVVFWEVANGFMMVRGMEGLKK